MPAGFRSNNLFKIAVVYRSDVRELLSTCQVRSSSEPALTPQRAPTLSYAAQLARTAMHRAAPQPAAPPRTPSLAQGVVNNAKSQLLNVVMDLPYTNGTNASIASMVDQIKASPAEAVIVCGLGTESMIMAQTIDAQSVPLKSIVITNGAYSRCVPAAPIRTHVSCCGGGARDSRRRRKRGRGLIGRSRGVRRRAWNVRLGKLSNATISFANWAPDLSARKDAFWGDSPTYSGKYKSAYVNEPTYIAAGESRWRYPVRCVEGCALRSEAGGNRACGLCRALGHAVSRRDLLRSCGPQPPRPAASCCRRPWRT